MSRSSSRRVFLIHCASAGAALLVGAQAQAQTMVDEKNAQASTLGYVADAKRADAK